MNAKQFHALLVELGACREAVLWARKKSLTTVWRTCKRGDWLLWLCGKMTDKPGWPTRKEVVLASCACARLSLKYVKAGETRPLNAIETAEAWTRGEATIEQVRAADAAAAYSAYAAANADAAAAYAAAYAAANAAAYSAYSAASAAYSAYAAANADAAAAARAKTLAKCAAIARKMLRPQGTR